MVKKPKKYNYPPPVQVRLAPEVREGLKHLAESEKRSMNSYLNLVLEKHVREEREKVAA